MTEHEQDLWTQDLEAELPSNREIAGFWFGFLAVTLGWWLIIGAPLFALAWWLW